MKIGDVLPMKSIRVDFDTGWVRYEAPKGERFVVVLLGSEPSDGSQSLDPVKAMEGLGWMLTGPEKRAK